MAVGAGAPMHHFLVGAPAPAQGQSASGRLWFGGASHPCGQLIGYALRSFGFGVDVDGE